MGKRSPSRDLQISPALVLPIETVTGTHVIYGRKRKGKTYKGKVLAEEMLEHRQQIVVIDPTDAWWGLRSSADGAAAGYPITIFGGRHADLPLEATAGEELADAISEDDFSAIFSLKGMSRANEQRFCYSFLERLYRRNPQKPLHIFMDEADIYAPQSPFGEEARTLGATQNMVRRGGLDGLGMTLITQRPAVLSKSVSSQCDMLISVGLNDPRDLAQVEDWVKANFEDRDLVRRLLIDIPTLGRPENRGIAWVLSPDQEITKRVMFRELRTFDSGRTPKVGEKRRAPRVLSKVDLDQLGKAIAATVERAKQSDPKALRQKVIELEKQLAKRLPAAPAPKPAKPAAPERIDPAQIQRCEKLVTRVRDENDRLHAAIVAIDAQRDRLAQAQQGLLSETGNLVTVLERASKPAAPVDFLLEKEKSGSVSVVRSSPHTNGHDRGKPLSVVRSDGTFEPLTKMEHRMLRCLAQHPDGKTKAELRLHCGYAESGPVSKCFAKLLAEGWAELVGNSFRICAAGRGVLGDFEPLPTGDALFDHLIAGSQLSGMEKKILSAIHDAYPSTISKQHARGAYAESGPVSRAFARLIAYGYALPLGAGTLKLAEELYG